MRRARPYACKHAPLSPDGRDVHCHGALPVPLVARLPRGGNCLPIIYQGNGKHAMAVDIPAVREVVERACTRKDVLDACERRDLGAVITALCAQGVTQGQLSVLTGIPQGRLSEYKTRKRTPTATSTFEAFADGLGMPPAARSAWARSRDGRARGRSILRRAARPDRAASQDDCGRYSAS